MRLRPFRPFPLVFLLPIAGLLRLGAQSTDNPIFIRVDQFGYQPDERKIAVLADPQVGFDAALSYTPGPTVQLRREPGDDVVLSGAPALWNNGATHADSGDKCWTFDFSAVTATGRYHVYDPATGRRSPSFLIARNALRQAAVQAARMFFYQRSGFAKKPPYVNARWADEAAFMRDNQDPKCRLVTALTNPATERDLRGGWFDAGDYNKYVTFTWDALQSLLLAYEEHPTVWGDDHAIPESGNGIPDLLDEIKWETDWLLRMQEPGGGVFNRVHDVPNTRTGSMSPASADNGTRAYGAVSTKSTVACADMYAHAAVVFRSLGRADMNAYADQLRAAAVKAWNWSLANPSVAYDDTGFGTRHEPAPSATAFAVSMSRAAAKLYVLTGDPVYRDYFDANYRKANLFAWDFAYVFEVPLQDALLYYARAPGATPSVVADIRTVYANAIRTDGDNLPRYLNAADPYQAFSSGGDYTWGSSRWKCEKGNMFAVMLTYGLDPANARNYRDAAAGYLHHIHGVNPLALVYLSNMSAFGAARSATEFYHHWFGNGTDWDSVVSSPKGPPPGYLTGGANPKYKPDSSYTGARLAPPLDQPAMKAYRDWNTSWPENSWEVTEPAIYYQAAYLRLIGGFLDDRSPSRSTVVNLSARAQVGAGSQAIFPGFVISGGASARVLVRAVGPTLVGYGVTGAAADPKLTLFSHATDPATRLFANDDWGQATDPAALQLAFAATGAFPLPAGSKDAALLVDLPPGMYSAMTENASGSSGVALVEAYDAGTGPRRLVNISCRAQVGTGANVLIPGIVVSGTDSMTLLIRAVGPTLKRFDVSGVLTDPVVSLFAGQQTIATNDNWQDQADVAAVVLASRTVGAFSLDDAGKDAALLVTLPPGLYTAHVSGKGAAAEGVALVEVYQVDKP